MKKLLTIAGSDSGGGAGIQADIKTFGAHGTYGMSVITAVTAQNTTGIYGIQEISPDMVKAQLQCVFDDLFPDGVKIGMVLSAQNIEIIGEILRQYHAGNVVLDPIMVSTSGSTLLEESAKKALVQCLFPCAHVITPNIPEVQELTGILIKTKKDMLLGAERIREFYSGSIVIKGGHLEDCADDLLLYGNQIKWFPGKKISSNHTHGTGCTLSSAIAANLAKGIEMEKAVESAKEYTRLAIQKAVPMGSGKGPLNHMG